MFLGSFALLDNVAIEIMSECGSGGQNKTRDYRKNGRERDCGDEGKEKVASQRFSEQRSCQVAPFILSCNCVSTYEGSCPETQKYGHNIENADDPSGIDN
ncbi:hypothetical protein D3C81_1275640 [compost metagenome]